MSEKIQKTIRAARDSVWVIENELQNILDRSFLTDDNRDNIRRNVEHLCCKHMEKLI